MTPRQLSNGLLDNCVGILSGPGVGEAAHVVEVGTREAGHLWEVATEIRGQSVDDLGAPALAPLAVENLVPNLPVELDQLAVDGEYGTSACGCDPRLDLGEELWIVGRQLRRPLLDRLSHGLVVPGGSDGIWWRSWWRCHLPHAVCGPARRTVVRDRVCRSPFVRPPWSSGENAEPGAGTLGAFASRAVCRAPTTAQHS